MELKKISFLPALAMAASLNVGCEGQVAKKTRDMVNFLASDREGCDFKPLSDQIGGDNFRYVTLPDSPDEAYSTVPPDKDPAVLIEHQIDKEILSFSFFDKSQGDLTVCVDKGLDGVDFCSNAFSQEKISFGDDGKIDQTDQRIYWSGRVSEAVDHALNRASMCPQKEEKL